MTTRVVLAVGAWATLGCGGPAGNTDSAGVDAEIPGACGLLADTTATGAESPSGCAVLDRDASACEATRAASGLAASWLAFSCRVELMLDGAEVMVATDGLPDHRSNYFAVGHACHETYDDAIQNPNTITENPVALRVPTTPDPTPRSMQGTGVVGVALSGVAIFGNFAAPGDDIFDEAATFDRCGAHPQMSGQYHYHGEPYALSYDDARLIGVMRDGYFVFGRRDADLSMPVLDVHGGHDGPQPDTGETRYHYHVNEQENADGARQWFLTTGTFHGAPGTCTGC